MGGKCGRIAPQEKMEVKESMLKGCYPARIIEPLPQRIGQGIGGGRILQQFWNHEVAAQNVGQSNPGLQLLAPHQTRR